MNESPQNIGMASAIIACPCCGYTMAAALGGTRALETGPAIPSAPALDSCGRCGQPLPLAGSYPATLPYAAPAPRPTFWQRIRTGRPWGFWSTTGIAFSTMLIHLAVGMVIAIFLIVAMMISRDKQHLLENAEDLAYNGMFVAVTTIIVAILTCAWLHVATVYRGVPWREYFAFRRPTVPVLALWIAVLLAWLVLEEAYTTYCLVDIKTSHFMNNILETAGFMPLFLLGVVVAAPISEEWLFRGFMFNGYARSPVGVVGAIGIPSLLWSLMHLQYDPGFIGVIFAVGLLLGAARYLTGTIVVPIVMHMVCNLLATLQVIYDIRLFPLD